MESIKIQGVQDELEIFEDRVVITPKGVLGFLNKGIKGSKEIPFSSISAIQFKEASTFINGYIQFTIPGGKESKGGIFSAVGDENTFLFASKSNEEMKRVKTFIYERTQSAPKTQTQGAGIADEILKLKKLKDDGVISESEFTEMKASLIKKAS